MFLLGKVKRRMNVKKKSEAENVNPEARIEPLEHAMNPFDNENDNAHAQYFGELTRAMYDDHSIHYANIFPQLDHGADRKHAKRRLFSEEKKEKRTSSPLQVVPQHPPTPQVFLPQALLNTSSYPGIYFYPNVPFGAGPYMTSNNLFQTNPNNNSNNNVFGNGSMNLQDYCESIYNGQ